MVNYRAIQTSLKNSAEVFVENAHNDVRCGNLLIRFKHLSPKFEPELSASTAKMPASNRGLWEETAHEKRTPKEFFFFWDTNSFITATVGGALFPGEQNKADFTVEDKKDEIDFAMQSRNKTVSVELKGKISENLPDDSIFSSLAEASEFFETGSLGYSVTKDEQHLDGIVATRHGS